MITTMHSDQNASPPRVEVITSIQRRRRWPTAEKIRLVERTMQPGMSVSQAVQADEDVVGTSRVRELERRVRELERLLGRKTMEVEILLAAAIVERSQGRFAMKAVADTLAVARSNLIERGSRRAKLRRLYRKADDGELLALIRRLLDERLTYGYRRIRRLILLTMADACGLVGILCRVRSTRWHTAGFRWCCAASDRAWLQSHARYQSLGHRGPERHLLLDSLNLRREFAHSPWRRRLPAFAADITDGAFYAIFYHELSSGLIDEQIF